MKYLCLAYFDVEKYEAMPKDEFAAIVAQCRARDEALHKSGHLLSVASLEMPAKAMSVRPRKGQSSVTDGPFIETKEQVGAFFLIEARDRDEALRVASLHPAATLGEHVGWGVEVRGIEFEA
jgi:hypothetical protein